MQWKKDHISYNFDPRKGPIGMKFFAGARTNVCYNTLDRHIKQGNGDRPAFLWEGNEPGTERMLSYKEALDQTCKLVSATASACRHYRIYRETLVFLPSPSYNACRQTGYGPRGSRRATLSASTCPWCQSCPLQCWPAPVSERFTASSLADSAAKQWLSAWSTAGPKPTTNDLVACTMCTEQLRSLDCSVPHVPCLNGSRKYYLDVPQCLIVQGKCDHHSVGGHAWKQKGGAEGDRGQGLPAQ